MKNKIDNYFQQARSWADDVYIAAIASRNRYRFAFLWSLLIISLFVVSLIFLLPLQHTELVIVHHMDDGTIWVERPTQQKLSMNRAQIQSDIVRYVINRESYSPSEYDHQFALVNLLSSETVAKAYQGTQDASNPGSPIRHFKNRTIRQVHVQNILFLNKEKESPLAQVNFTVTDRDRLTGHQKQHAFLALVRWKYHGTPKDPASQWQNWDGFTVTHYSVQQRNI